MSFVTGISLIDETVPDAVEDSSVTEISGVRQAYTLPSRPVETEPEVAAGSSGPSLEELMAQMKSI